MRLLRPASTILAALAFTLAALVSVPAYADDDDGPSAGDVIGVLTNPKVLGAITDASVNVLTSTATNGISSVASAAAGGIAGSMADGAIALLEEFSNWMTNWTVIDLNNAGIDSPLALALGTSMLIAWLLLVLEAGRSAYTGDGTAIGNALVGLLKMTVVVALLVPFMQALLMAADELTNWIVDESFGGMDGLRAKLTDLFEFDPILGFGLMFVFGLVGIILVLLLMFEFVLRHAGILIMLCAAPIAAAGMLSRPTSDWWPKAAKGLLTLVMLKPVVAFIFAIAFGILGDSEGVKGLVVGMAALVAAAVAWPVVASYFTFTSIGSGGSVGAAIAGGAAGWLGGRASGGGRPSGAAAAAGSQHSLAVERESDGDHAGSRVRSLSGAALGRSGGSSGAMSVLGSPRSAGTNAVSAKSGGVTGGLVAATAAVNATRAGIESTSAGLTDMARHADLATPYPASGPNTHSAAATNAGRHARHEPDKDADVRQAEPLADQHWTGARPDPVTSEEQEL